MAAMHCDSWRQCALLMACAALLALAAGAREPQPMEGASFISPNQGGLLTYFFDATKPEVQLLPAGPRARPGRTPLRVTLPSQAAVSAFMPVLSPRAAGMTHQVVNTWAALKNYALMFSRVNAVNEQQAAAGAARLFPRPGIAVTAAAADAGAAPDVGGLIDAAEAQGQLNAWAETSPGSVLLMPFGQSVAGVADVMGIAHDEAADTIALDLDLVHDPDIVSEFAPHGKQTLEASSSHYHFYAPAGVRLDAAGLLKALQEARYELPGLHVFVKGELCTTTATSSAGPSPNSAFTRVTVTQGNTQCGGGPTRDKAEKVVSCGEAQVQIIDTNGQLIAISIVSSCSSPEVQPDRDLDTGTKKPGGGAAAVAQVGPNPFNLPLLNGIGVFDVKFSGRIIVRVLNVNGNQAINLPNAQGLALPVGAGTLMLTPAKAYRHVHDSITLTALALAADGAAVAGVPVTFAVVGDCEPVLASTTAVTDAGGRAAAVISAKKPGAVAVVAATAGVNGGRLVTPASHIIFFKERHYVEHKERHYYGGGYEDRWGETQAYSEVQADADSDAERFAAEAAKKVMAQLPA